MTGGLMKTTVSRLALAAIASVVATGAMAADLGGNCCADLEERVSELEATAARKGNRKVSLTVSGQINKMIVWHNSDSASAHRDGEISIQDNLASQSRFRFVGSAKIDADRTAGYVLEIGVSENEGVGLGADAGNNRLRQNHVFLQSARLGKVSVGLLSQATDGLYDISLANIRHFVEGGVISSSPNRLLGGNVGTVFPGLGGGRTQALRYDTPVFAGFTLSATYGHNTPTIADNVDADNTTWDIALRYAGEFNGIRLAAGIGYRDLERASTVAPGDTEADRVWVGSGSILHVPTGLFISGGMADRNRTGTDVAGDDIFAYHGQLGIQRNWFGIGDTTLFGEYGKSEFDIQGGNFRDGDFWGLGFNQNISAAATDLYISFRNYEADNIVGANNDDVSVVLGGMRINF